MTIRSVQTNAGLTPELFDTTKQNMSLHLKNIYEDGELEPSETVKESLTVQVEGFREVQRSLTLYALDAILAAGYRHRVMPLAAKVHAAANSRAASGAAKFRSLSRSLTCPALVRGRASQWRVHPCGWNEFGA